MHRYQYKAIRTAQNQANMTQQRKTNKATGTEPRNKDLQTVFNAKQLQETQWTEGVAEFESTCLGCANREGKRKVH